LPDGFLEESIQLLSKTAQSPARATDSSATGSTAAPAVPAQSAGDSAGSISDPELGKTFTAIQALLTADLVKSVNAVYVFNLKGMWPRS
jgi:hypothetical protein